MVPTSAAAATEFGQESLTLGAFPEALRAQASAVSWGAVTAGAAAAAALSLILLLLGVGLGLSALSPWSNAGASATTIGWSTVLWLSFTQLAASGMGGYLAGRLRTKWTGVHTDEVYFRDTAHGFLAWAIASLATAALLTSAVGSIVGSAVQSGATLAGSAANTAAVAAAAGTSSTSNTTKPDREGDSMGYFVDTLFRTEANAAATATTPPGLSRPSPINTVPGGFIAAPGMSAATAAEVTRIFVNHLPSGALPADDVRYVGQIVAQRTGLTQQEAEKRVADTYARVQLKLRDAEITAKEAADKARKASAYTALWLFISMLIGAFVASWAATFGGRNRDN